jgi:hypothetical protein
LALSTVRYAVRAGKYRKAKDFNTGILLYTNYEAFAKKKEGIKKGYWVITGIFAILLIIEIAVTMSTGSFTFIYLPNILVPFLLYVFHVESKLLRNLDTGVSVHENGILSKVVAGGRIAEHFIPFTEIDRIERRESRLLCYLRGSKRKVALTKQDLGDEGFEFIFKWLRGEIDTKDQPRLVLYSAKGPSLRTYSHQGTSLEDLESKLDQT